jgi:hypothetical protein
VAWFFLQRRIPQVLGYLYSIMLRNRSYSGRKYKTAYLTIQLGYQNKNKDKDTEP